MSDAKNLRTTTTGLIRKISDLMAEFKVSKLGIDEFVRQKMKESRPDGEQYAKRMLMTFSEIDANYADIKQARAKGVNRQDWIREKIEKSISDVNADKKRDMVGRVLGMSLAALKGDNGGGNEETPFEGIDAVEMVEAVEEGLAGNAIASIGAREV